MAGLTETPFDPVYAMTKHALIGLIRSVASGLAEQGVRVQAVCPGLVDTPLLGQAKSELDAANFPLLTAYEVAEVLVECIHGVRTDTVTVVQVGDSRSPTGSPTRCGLGPLPEHLPIGRIQT